MTFSIIAVSKAPHCTEFLSLLGLEIWELVPPCTKQVTNFSSFKRDIEDKKLDEGVGFKWLFHRNQ